MRTSQIVRALRTALLAVTVLALSMPMFWMIDAMQAGQIEAQAQQSPHTHTLRFDESRSEQEVLEVVTEDPQSADGCGSIAASGHADTALTAQHVARVSTPVSECQLAMITPPALSTQQRMRIERLLLPIPPVHEVPTSPPLVAA